MIVSVDSSWRLTSNCVQTCSNILCITGNVNMWHCSLFPANSDPANQVPIKFIFFVVKSSFSNFIYLIFKMLKKKMLKEKNKNRNKKMLILKFEFWRIDSKNQNNPNLIIQCFDHYFLYISIERSELNFY